MPKRVELQYWDASIFIAWLSNREQNLTVEEIEGVRALVRMAMTGHSRIITSVITFTEVLEGYMSTDAQVLFEQFMKRRNVTAITNHIGVARMAALIRNTYVEKTDDYVASFLFS